MLTEGSAVRAVVPLSDVASRQTRQMVEVEVSECSGSSVPDDALFANGLCFLDNGF